MSVKLSSYINFNGNAKEAVEFYHSIFGGRVESDTFGGFNEKSGGAMPVAEEDSDRIMHAALYGDHVELMVSDTMSSWPPSPTESNIVLTLNGDDEEILRNYWNKLLEGGKVVQPLEAAPWGDTFGSLTDKFGVSWMVNISPKQQA